MVLNKTLLTQYNMTPSTFYRKDINLKQSPNHEGD